MAGKEKDSPSTSSGRAGLGRGTRASAGRIASGKNRRVQIVPVGARKLFDKAAKTVFLEWFAATCNVKFSAAKAGVAYQTVFKHRMKDEGFAAAWDKCLAQGYARVEAQSVETRIEAGRFEVDGDWDAPELQEMDPHLRIALLREHRRSLPEARGGGGPLPFGVARKQGWRPRTATNAEVRAALVKRLVVFGVRVSGEAGV